MVEVTYFKTKGKTYTERLRYDSKSDSVKIIWHHLNFIRSVDTAGETLASIGESHKRKSPRKKKIKDSFGPNIDLSGIQLEHARRQDAIESAWDTVDRLTSLMGRGLTLSPTTYLYHEIIQPREMDYFVYNGIPSLKQFNYGSVESGCGPTAWAALCCFHDLHYDPDLLYGTHGFGINSLYLKRLVKIFHDRLGTDDDGDTWCEDVQEYLLQITPGSNEWDDADIRWFAYDVPGGGDEVWNFVYDIIWYSDQPAIVYYPTDSAFYGHMALAVGMAEAWAGGHYLGAFVEIHKQLSESAYDLEYISLDEIEGVWAINKGNYICQRKTTISEHSLHSMDMADIANNIFAVWTNENGKICLAQTNSEAYDTPQRNLAPKAIGFGNKVVLCQRRGFYVRVESKNS